MTMFEQTFLLSEFTKKKGVKFSYKLS